MKNIKNYEDFEEVDLLESLRGISNFFKFSEKNDLVSNYSSICIHLYRLLNDICIIISSFEIVDSEGHDRVKELVEIKNLQEETKSLIKEIDTNKEEKRRIILNFDPNKVYEEIKSNLELLKKSIARKKGYRFNRDYNQRKSESGYLSLNDTYSLLDEKIAEISEIYRIIKKFNPPKYDSTDIEDILLEFMDDRSIRFEKVYCEYENILYVNKSKKFRPFLVDYALDNMDNYKLYYVLKIYVNPNIVESLFEKIFSQIKRFFNIENVGSESTYIRYIDAKLFDFVLSEK